MTFDLRLQRTCSHEIFDELVSLGGLSPNYFSILLYGSDGASNLITIREFSETEGLSSFVYRRDGFTNWQLSGDFAQINWNSAGLGGPGTGVAAFLDGSTMAVPAPDMMVSYRTKPEKCPLCLGGQGLTKDIDFDLHGRLRVLTGNDKVRHLVFKAVLTEVGANEILPDYGSTLSASIGQKFDTLLQMRLYNGVQQSVQFLLNEQQSQPALPLPETIVSVSNVTVTQSTVDPRVALISMQVMVADFSKVTVSFNLVTS